MNEWLSIKFTTECEKWIERRKEEEEEAESRKEDEDSLKKRYELTGELGEKLILKRQN